MLQLTELKKQYATGELALKGVTLEIPRGQVLALIGPSGAGKSTLIRCINRLVQPTSGNVRLNDQELTKLSSRALRRARRKIGMIFQEYALVERLTVMENVLSGRLGYVGFWRSYFRKFSSADVQEAYRLLDRVGLKHMADKRADELSGGQRQILALARAFSTDPSYMLLDEPTSAMDPRSERLFVARMKEYTDGKTLVVVTHRKPILALVSRVLVVERGQIVMDGTRDEVLKKISS